MEGMENTATNQIEILPKTFTTQDLGRIFDADFLDETSCRKWIINTIHGPGEKTCPECHATITGRAYDRFNAGQRIRCRSCGAFFTAKSRTFLAGCHLSYKEIVLMAVFLYFQIPRLEIAKILHVTQETVRLWENKFKAIASMKIIATLGGGETS